MTHRLAICVIALLVASVGAGCGTSDEDRIRDLGREIGDAGRAGNYLKACSYATPELLGLYGGQQGCAAALASEVARRRFDFSSIHIASVRVVGDRGVVAVDSPVPFQAAVEKVDGRWLVAGL